MSDDDGKTSPNLIGSDGAGEATSDSPPDADPERREELTKQEPRLTRPLLVDY